MCSKLLPFIVKSATVFIVMDIDLLFELNNPDTEVHSLVLQLRKFSQSNNGHKKACSGVAR